MTERALVIGGGVCGTQAALDIVGSGIPVTLVEMSPELHIEFGGEGEVFILRPKLLEAYAHPGIQVLTNTEVVSVGDENGAFTAKVLRHPRYVSEDSCTSCGRCEQACPVNVSSQFERRSPKAIRCPGSGEKSVPSTRLVEKQGVPPCTAACPAGVNVQGYVALISKGLFKEALDLIKEAVPFPHILGRVCTHPCETACTRGKIDQPIAIASLKRFVADTEPIQYTLSQDEISALSSGQPRVAIIGSGPAGLTCARDLLGLGYRSVVFEALPVAGGMIAVGMPRFRLPHEVRETEINALVRSGIEIRTLTPIGKDLTIGDLRGQGYEAVFVATGAHKNQRLKIPGEDLEGVIDSIDFLRALNLKQPVRVGKTVAVIGGGYTAIDSARAAVRLYCQDVSLLYRRTANEMFATEAEILETTEEGVVIDYLVSPTRIIGEDGKVVAIECQRMELGGKDADGRPRPIPIEGSEFLMEVDTVITAIGQLPDLDIFRDINLEDNGETLVADPLTLSTNEPGIFAGGDAVTGPQSMVTAVAAGRRAAVSIDRYLRGEDLTQGRTIESPIPVDVNLEDVKVHPGQRRRIPCLPISDRVGNFEEVETGYSNWMAIREAKRCLNCAGCSDCMECVRACEQGAIDHRMQPEALEFEASAVVVALSPEDISQSISLRRCVDEGAYVIPTSADQDVAIGLTRASAVAGRVVVEMVQNGSIESGRMHRDVSLRRQAEQYGPKAGKPRVGVFVCRCGGSISDVIDMPKLVGQFVKQNDVAYAQEIGYACSEEGAAEIREMSKTHELTHVVLAACSCCSLDQICFSCTDRRIECKRRLLGSSLEDGLCYEFINIREHCAWVHSRSPQEAMAKAKVLIKSAVARVRNRQLQHRETLNVRQGVLVVGGGFSGMQAAADLAALGFATTLIRSEGSLFACEVVNKDNSEWLEDELRRRDVKVLEAAQLDDLQGLIGEYRAVIRHQGELIVLNVGVVIVDISVPVIGPDGAIASHLMENLSPVRNALTDDRDMVSDSWHYFYFYDKASRVTGIYPCGIGSAKTDVEAGLSQGSAVAIKVVGLLRRGEVPILETVARVDDRLCRGCGTCSSVCVYNAPSLVDNSHGGLIATVNESLCRGCGVCVAHCPSGALSQMGGNSDGEISTALEAMLTQD